MGTLPELKIKGHMKSSLFKYLKWSYSNAQYGLAFLGMQTL